MIKHIVWSLKNMNYKRINRILGVICRTEAGLNEFERRFQVGIQMSKENENPVRKLDVKMAFSTLSLFFCERLPLQFCHCCYKKDI